MPPACLEFHAAHLSIVCGIPLPRPKASGAGRTNGAHMRHCRGRLLRNFQPFDDYIRLFSEHVSMQSTQVQQCACLHAASIGKVRAKHYGTRPLGAISPPVSFTCILNTFASIVTCQLYNMHQVHIRQQRPYSTTPGAASFSMLGNRRFDLASA